MNVQPEVHHLAPVYSLPARRGGDPYSVANGRDARLELVCWVATRVRVGRLQGMVPSAHCEMAITKMELDHPLPRLSVRHEVGEVAAYLLSKLFSVGYALCQS
jgi:hypothetical protein